MSGVIQTLIGSGRGEIKITLTSTQTNYDLYTAAVAANNGSTALPLKITLILNSGGIIGGSAGTVGGSSGAYAIYNSNSSSPYYSTLYANGRWSQKGAVGLIISNSFNPSTRFEIKVNSGGAIYGGSGCGGISGGALCGNPSYRYGGDGGNAINILGNYKISITVASGGKIWAGGGGGAGAPYDVYCDARRYGGLGNGYESQIAGSYGTSPLPDFGGSGVGGYGGAWATAGGADQTTGTFPGGAAGVAISNTGGSTITLVNNGSILGSY